MKAGLRLALISVFVVLLLILVWASLKTFEKSPTDSVAPSWSHPLAELKTWNLRRPENCSSKEAFRDQFNSSSPDDIWFLDIQSQQEEWVVFCSQASTAQVFQKWQQGQPLDLALQHFLNSPQFIIFNIHASQKKEAEDFLDKTKDFEKSRYVGVVSASRLPIGIIRKERPQWFFGSDRTSWTKVLALNSLMLGGLVDAWADFYILSEEDQEILGRKSALLESLYEQNKVLIKEVSSEFHSPEKLKFYRGTLPVSSPVARE